MLYLIDCGSQEPSPGAEGIGPCRRPRGVAVRAGRPRQLPARQRGPVSIAGPRPKGGESTGRRSRISLAPGRPRAGGFCPASVRCLRCLAASASAWTVSPWARPPSSSVGRRTSSSFLSWRPGIGCRAREVIEALWPHLTADAGAANLRKAARVACARQSRPRSCSAADRSRPRPRPKRRPMCGDSRTRATLVCTPAICCPQILRRVDARGARSLAARGCSGPSIKQADTDDRQSPHPGRGSTVGRAAA